MTELLPIFRAHFFPMAGHAVVFGELHGVVHRPIWIGSPIFSHYFADLRSARSRCWRSRRRRRWCRHLRRPIGILPIDQIGLTD
jgi:hypothetical protein